MFLIDCGLIHKYLIAKEDIEKFEEKTFLTISVIKDLSGYKIERENDKLILSNGTEKLIFKKVKVGDLEYMLDEFCF